MTYLYKHTPLEVTVPVTITDESGQSPIQAEMVWAWVPKKRG